VFDFKTRFTPINLFTGLLAESWEIKDFQTITFHIRKGVHFQNIPPVNGRELTAYDAEFTWQRLLGLGSGYTKPTQYVNVTKLNLITSVNATDKYTFVVTLRSPSITTTREVLEDFYAQAVLPRDAIQQWWDLDTWKRAIGSGPFIMQEYVVGSSLTAVKNPDYWGYDEQNTQDRLPYIDKVRILILPDSYPEPVSKPKPAKEPTIIDMVTGSATMMGIAVAVLVVLLALIWAAFSVYPILFRSIRILTIDRPKK